MRLVLTLALVAALPTGMFAQEAGRPLRSAIDRQASMLSQTAQAAAPVPPAHRSWVARHPVLTGALAGLAVGFSIGAATCAYPGSEGSCDYYTYPGNARLLGGLTIGGLGAGIGAVAGAVAGRLSR